MAPTFSLPPSISTLPFSSSVAVCWARGRVIAPPSSSKLVAGSNSSTEVVALPLLSRPPVKSTLSSGKRVAACSLREVISAEAFLAARPVAGSNSSRVATEQAQEL